MCISGFDKDTKAINLLETWREVLYKCGQARIGWKGLASGCQRNVIHKANASFLMWNGWKTVINVFLIITEIINSHIVVSYSEASD